MSPPGSLLIRGVRLLDPVAGVDGVRCIGLRGGAVDHVGDTAPAQTYEREIDGSALWLMPAAIDLAVRFREPGQTHKASFASEAPAALAAGIGGVVLAPDTQPVVDTPAVVDRLRSIAARHPGLDVHLLGALTVGLRGEALSEMGALKRAGCAGFSHALAPLRDPLVARRALEYARGLDSTVHVFAQDAQLANNGCAHDGAVATRLGLPAIPAAAEVAAVRMWLSLVEDTAGRVHFARLSTARGAELVAAARRRGLPVTADVAAHQLFLTDAAIEGFNALAHVIPPLRAQADLEGLRAALRNGDIDAICSDHQPHESDAKINPFPLTEPGISALETLLPLTLALVREKVLAPLQAAERLHLGPLRILQRRPSAVEPGCRIPLALVDPDTEWCLQPAALHSSGRHTPFAGRLLRGRALATLHAALPHYGDVPGG